MSRAVIEHPRFSIFVFEQRAIDELPRCHVRRGEGEAETLVSLPLLDVLAGPRPSREEWEELLGGLQQIVDAWAELNDPA